MIRPHRSFAQAYIRAGTSLHNTLELDDDGSVTYVKPNSSRPSIVSSYSTEVLFESKPFLLNSGDKNLPPSDGRKHGTMSNFVAIAKLSVGLPAIKFCDLVHAHNDQLRT